MKKILLLVLISQINIATAATVIYRDNPATTNNLALAELRKQLAGGNNDDEDKNTPEEKTQDNVIETPQNQPQEQTESEKKDTPKEGKTISQNIKAEDLLGINKKDETKQQPKFIPLTYNKSSIQYYEKKAKEQEKELVAKIYKNKK